MSSVEELAARVEQLTALVEGMRRTLYPVDASGLPVPTETVERDQTNISGPRWQVGKHWTVIAEAEPEDEHCLYLRDMLGQSTGDVRPLSPAVAVQVAGALLAAARWSGDDLRKRRTSGVLSSPVHYEHQEEA